MGSHRERSARTFARAVVALSFLAFSPADRAGAAPRVIDADTLWEGSVEVSDEVRVAKGAMLVIGPGTVVRFAAQAGPAKARLLVNGTLVAQGSADAPVIFTSAAAAPRPGDWGGLVIEHANERTNRISHARIEYAEVGIAGAYSALRVESTSVRNSGTGIVALQDLRGSIFDSTISANTRGVSYSQSSAFQMENCEVSGNRNGGVGCGLGSSPVVRRCAITDNGEHGVACIQGSSPLLEGNAIRGHRRGVFVELQSKPAIVRNTVTGNDTGIWSEKYAFPKIFANVIERNGVGIYCNFASYPEIRGNNIADNERFALVLGDNMSIKVEKLIPYRSGGRDLDAAPANPEVLPLQSRKFAPFGAGEEGVVDARGNWWGAGVLAEMERLGEGGDVAAIEDYFDKPDTFYQNRPYPRDRVQYWPWERGPIADAATPPSSYARIEGKVVSSDRSVAGVRVHAYGDAEGAFAGVGFTYSAPSAKDGAFALNLPGGTYFLVAKGPRPAFPHAEPGPGAYFGVYGANPLQAAAGETTSVTLQVERKPE